VLDVGTGTGILALACAKLGAETVIAIDNDQDAVVTALDNIKQNNEQYKIQCSTTPLDAITTKADLIIANITADVLTLLQPNITPKIKKGGHLALAGILTGGQSRAIINLYQTSGLTLIAENQEDEWTGLLFTQKP
jgi:ribosomal protein L11 methyltransferase